MPIRAHDAQSAQRPVTPEPEQHQKHSFRLGMWQRLHGFFSKDDDGVDGPVHSPDHVSWPDQPPPQSKTDCSARRVGVGLPRQATFRRQNSERRERLLPVEPDPAERRAFSHSRVASSSLPRPRSNSTPLPSNPGRTSAPAVPHITKVDASAQQQDQLPSLADANQLGFVNDTAFAGVERPPRPPSITSSITSREARFAPTDNKAQINAELDTRWILNLSMHFRDKSDREKFFVTYAETPTKWRRVTVSCDYRNAEPGSLEMDLKELQFQRDKSMQIYESIRDSLLEIQFYDTVTNLKLETSDGRLHVHVTEDQNEIVPFPPRTTVAHILQDPDYRPMEIPESELAFDSHLSGFVYKVRYNDRVYIKKEIPGPDTVDEFLYEINALHALHGSEHVIPLEAIVVDDSRQIVKGLLIEFAEQGAIADLLYDQKGKIPLEERLRWARDSVVGLSEIHQEGFVQGDFTLSNIVVDAEGNAKIIDINRRGCPVGWEPPEIATKIASHQRISMYIGEKSDIYQLGMTLWGLAADDDEPERQDPPLRVDDLPAEVPDWYRDIVQICLSNKPRDRFSAKELARMFRSPEKHDARMLSASPIRPDVRNEKRYIDPAQAVERDDIAKFGASCQDHDMPYSPQSSKYDDTFTYPRSSNYDRASDISAWERPRGRTPPTNLEHLSRQERYLWTPEEIISPSTDDMDAQIVSVSPRQEPVYDEIDFDGRPFLIARNTFSDEELQILEHSAQFNQSIEDQQRPTGHGTSAVRSGSSDFPRRRPALPSRTSATSSSTPRNSQAMLHKVSFGQSNDYRTWGPFSDSQEQPGVISSNDAAQSSQIHLGPPLDRRESTSPQPPPSLSYADSGFHEPLNFVEDVEQSDFTCEESDTPNQPVQVPSMEPSESGDQDGSWSAAPHLPHKLRAISPGPPPLLRSDTSIKVGAPQPSPEASGTFTDTEALTSAELGLQDLTHATHAQDDPVEAITVSSALISSEEHG
jgi:serine/threonine protein kinase